MDKVSNSQPIGIPRGLINTRWELYFESFFRSLGVSVRWSSPGTYETFLRGKKRILDEFCLPLKLFAGHVLELAEETDLKIFIPMIGGNRKKNCFLCPLQFRLGDIMVNSGLLPKERLLSPCFVFDDDMRLSPEGEDPLTGDFNVQHPRTETEFSTEEPERTGPDTRPVIAVIGRSYVLKDPWLSRGIPGLLEDMGFRVVLCGGNNCPGFGDKSPADYSHFALTASLIREAEQLFREILVDGAVILKPFLCGPDCDIENNISDIVPKGKNIPFLVHVIDENRSDEGLITRLEAFSDVVRSRKESA